MLEEKKEQEKLKDKTRNLVISSSVLGGCLLIAVVAGVTACAIYRSRLANWKRVAITAKATQLTKFNSFSHGTVNDL